MLGDGAEVNRGKFRRLRFSLPWMRATNAGIGSGFRGQSEIGPNCAMTRGH
jgi:hypothetical protein